MPQNTKPILRTLSTNNFLTMTEVQDEVSELISTLASIKLDSSSDRKDVVREAELLLTQNEGKELEEIQIAQEALAALTFKPGA